MARYIHCPSCESKLQGIAKQNNELYESIEGTAACIMFCDSCGLRIEYGDTCFASVLLNNREHPNYERQRPEAWARSYIYF